MNKDIEKLVKLRTILSDAKKQKKSGGRIQKLRTLVLRQEQVILKKIVEKYYKRCTKVGPTTN